MFCMNYVKGLDTLATVYLFKFLKELIMLLDSFLTTHLDNWMVVIALCIHPLC